MKNFPSKTIEEVALLTVASGATTGNVKVTPPAGFVTHIVAHFDTPPNTGFVQAYLKDAAGLEIAKLQPVSSLRSRSVKFEVDGKPVNIETNNRTFEFGVIATAAFSADFPIALVFIYKQENC